MITRRTAICRGAIYKGLIDRPEVEFLDGGDKIIRSPESCSPIVIGSTIARHSLGVVSYMTYEKRLHEGQDTFWDDIEEVEKVGGRRGVQDGTSEAYFL